MTSHARPGASRRAVLKAGGTLGTVALLAAPVAFLPEAKAASVDPVFAAIQAVNDSWATVETLVEDQCAIQRAGGDASAEIEEAIAAEHAKGDAVRRAMLTTVPTTRAGMLAMLAVINTYAGWRDCAMDDDEIDALLANFRGYVLAGGPNG